MNLSDFISIIFDRNKNWSKIKKTDKASNFYLFNRRIAIKFPHHANHLNRVGINLSAASTIWRTILSKNFTSPPNWIWSYVNRKDKIIKEKKIKISDELINFYIQKNEISTRDFEFMINTFKNETIEDILRYKIFIEDI